MLPTPSCRIRPDSRRDRRPLHHSRTLATTRPTTGNVDLSIGILDIAQDFLLARLYNQGFGEVATFKGGTSLRKQIAGSSGRFSTDLDFAATDAKGRDAVADILTELTDGTELGPFRYQVTYRKAGDRPRILVTSDLGAIDQTMKVDIGPPAWITPDITRPVPTLIHDRYGFAMPAIPTMTLAETLGEKIARLNRRSTARDAYDLVWIASNPPYSGFDRPLVRRLAVLKICADLHGLGGAAVAVGAGPFDPQRWLRTRTDWGSKDIGLLAAPPPSLADLGTDLVARYGFLGDLTEDEASWARTDPRQVADVVKGVATTDGVILSEADLWNW